jgi:hypothetical protein
MTGQFINDIGHEVPAETIVVIPNSTTGDGWYKEIIHPLAGNPKRDWFSSHFYYCLPLNIGNQYGFVIKSLRDFDVFWDGTDNDAQITFINDDNFDKQIIQTGFSKGIITVQNYFSLKTPLGVNLMTIQPPNMFIPGCVAMTGVIETDQIKRDFTFNFKITIPKTKISIRKGDALGAFIPIPRYFVDNFKLALVGDIFDEELHLNELKEQAALSYERNTSDRSRPHQAGRRYFNGVHIDNTEYLDHQKRLS